MGRAILGEGIAPVGISTGVELGEVAKGFETRESGHHGNPVKVGGQSERKRERNASKTFGIKLEERGRCHGNGAVWVACHGLPN